MKPIRQNTDQAEIAELRLRLQEAEETLKAIQTGQVDALVITEGQNEQIFTLKSADYTYRLLVESMNEGAVTILEDHTILYCNISFAQLVEVPLEKVIGTPINQYIPESQAAAFNQLFDTTKGASSHEMSFRTKTKVIPALVSFTKLDIDGRPAINMIVTDLSERKMAEEARLEVMRSREQVRLKDEFVGIVSHELRTPVTSIKAYAQIMQRRFIKLGDSASAANMARIDSQLNNLTQLISDLTDVTKIESGKLRLNYTIFDFDQFIADTVGDLQLTSDDHKIKVEGKTNIKLRGDKDRIGQVLINLVTNAIKYSPHNSDVKVRLSCDSRQVTIAVKDFGIGIDPAEQKHVFERFYQSETTVGAVPGLGLGLYISAEIVKRMEGRIWVESKPGAGATFCFSLPINPSPPTRL